MELIEAIKKAGVVGAGGAGFPTHVKLNAKAEYLIINAAECEPLIETDKFLCREFADRIIDTILLMGHHLEAHGPAALLPGAGGLPPAVLEEKPDDVGLPGVPHLGLWPFKRRGPGAGRADPLPVPQRPELL